MKCFYHSGDFDGICSGAIIKYKFPKCEMFPIDYGQSFPWDLIAHDEIVYMIDFSLQPFEDMDKLNKLVNLIWIDHHKRTIESCAKYNINGRREVGTSGCELTWLSIFPNDKMPTTVHLLGRYDVWDHTQDVIPFQYGMRLRDPDDILPGSILWSILFNPTVSVTDVVPTIIKKGNIVWKYIKSQDKVMMKFLAFDGVLDGFRALIVNLPKVSSYSFDSIWDPDKYDIMVAFSRDPLGHWRVSLRTPKPDVDCSEIAARYGGGGHREAAGFQTDDLFFIE